MSENSPMRKALLMFLFSMLFTLPAAIYPVDSEIGPVIEAEEGSRERMVIDALCESFSPEWISAHAEVGKEREFSLFYSDTLSSLLPLGNPIVSAESEGAIRIKDTAKGVLVTVFLDEEGRITSLSVRESPRKS